ncbi:phosphonate C-P lyase system protein PhnK [Grimontia celer]|uniref:Phosphonate C-P lyase system protein PhnK n=1 Tax=Grimontia celer TaxID=1796497 RepID=A0A128FCC5_9GAMM|nr:AAA family ATPase [Grimontia celer]CZF83984.1 phosphonate C-P lyase system protein PhnK [Grimontia celer]
MKIESIIIEGLFGIFTHEISFSDDDITIIIGENGLGKTVLLEMLDNIFKYNFDQVKEVTFKKLTITFTDKSQWLLQVHNEKGQNRLKIRNPESAKNKWINLDEHSKSARRNRLNRRSYLIENENGDVVERVYRHYDEDDIFIQKLINQKKSRNQLPNWFLEKVDHIKIELIETQRILTKHGKNDEKYKSTIMYCAQDLKEKLQSYSNKAQNITANLDSTFPNRVIEKLNKITTLTSDDINEKLNKLNDRRKELASVGLLTNINLEDIQNLKKNEASVFNFISQYIEDSKEKLEPYNEIHKQLSLFLRITNARLKHKKISSCMNNGFKVQSTILYDEQGSPLEFPFEKLSSGEQHEIILFYKLIFLYGKGSLVLIDEPELSLHISWQNNFINDIKEIISQNNLSVIIATHSPDLIGNHWNLTQKLVGLES